MNTGWGSPTAWGAGRMLTITRGGNQLGARTLLDWAVPKLSSSDAVSVVIFPVTPEMWNRRSPRSCTELNLRRMPRGESHSHKGPSQGTTKNWAEKGLEGNAPKMFMVAIMGWEKLHRQFLFLHTFPHIFFVSFPLVNIYYFNNRKE